MDSSRSRLTGKPGSADQTTATALGAVAEALATMRYGAIELTIHDGKVVQLDVTERSRFA
ncbi:MAG: YezD family protein [Novosphingobium sp.]